MYRCYESWTPNARDTDIIDTADGIAQSYSRQGLDLTLRQLYYQFVAHHGLPNSDQSYKRLGNVINKARLAGLFNWDLLVDRGRMPSLYSFWDSPDEIVRSSANAYEIDKLATQSVHVEVWVEKDALAQVITTATSRYDVPSFACKGYTSASAMWRAARRLYSELVEGKAVHILHLGDHDPSGLDMTRDIRDRLSRFIEVDWLHDHRRDLRESESSQTITDHIRRSLRDGSREPFIVERIALNMDQIEQYDPPPNPAKITDSRAAGYIEQFGSESWELDALDPDTLVALITDHLENLLDLDAIAALQQRENSEREALTELAARWDDVRDFLGV
jgi:hypothetical protein